MTKQNIGHLVECSRGHLYVTATGARGCPECLATNEQWRQEREDIVRREMLATARAQDRPDDLRAIVSVLVAVFVVLVVTVVLL